MVIKYSKSKSTLIEETIIRPEKRELSFFFDVLKLASGTSVAYAMVILAMPIITRLFGPEAFGLSALFTSLVSIFCILACLRYEIAIMLPKSDEHAANLLGISILSIILVSLVTFIIINLGGHLIVNVLNAPGLGRYLWILPFSVFFGGVFQALSYWSSRTKNFGRLSIARFFSSIAIISTQLGAGLSGYVTGGSLIIAGVIGSVVSATMLAIQILKNDKSLLRHNIKIKCITWGFNRYRKFLIYDTWSALLNTISWQAPAFLLSIFFSPLIVGFYALCFSVIQLPMSLIGGAISLVLFQRATEAKLNNELENNVEKIYRILAKLIIFPMLMMTIIGKDFFLVFFGEKWAEAGVYMQILSPWALIWFLLSPFSVIFGVLERQEFELKVNIFNISSRIIAISLGGILGNPRISIALFSLSGIIVYSYLGIASMNLSGVNFKNIIRPFISNFVTFVPAGSILFVLELVGLQANIIVFVSFALIIIYYIFIFRSDLQLSLS